MHFFQSPLSTVASAIPTSVVHAVPSTVAHAVPASCEGDGPNDLASCKGCRCAILFTILFGGVVLAVVAMQTPRARKSTGTATGIGYTSTDRWLPSSPPPKTYPVGVYVCSQNCPKTYTDAATQKSPYIVFSKEDTRGKKKTVRSENNIATLATAAVAPTVHHRNNNNNNNNNNGKSARPTPTPTVEQQRFQQVQHYDVQALGAYKGPSGDDYVSVEFSSDDVPLSSTESSPVVSQAFEFDRAEEEGVADTGEFVPDRVIVLPPCTCAKINVQPPSMPPCTCHRLGQQQHIQPKQDHAEKEPTGKCRKRKSRRRRKQLSQTASSGLPADRRRSESRSQTRVNIFTYRPRQCSEEPQRGTCPQMRSRPRGKRKARH